MALGEVAIRTFGGAVGSQSEKYDANWSESMSEEVSGAMDTPFTGAVLGSLEPLAGCEEVEPALSRVCWAADRWSRRKGRTPFGCQGSLGHPAPTVSEVKSSD